MIALVLSMVWARRGQAVTLALLAMFAVAAAVAAPAYLRATDRAVAAGQIGTATPAELGLEISALSDSGDEGQPDGGVGVGFSDVGAALADLPGFDYVYAADLPAVGMEPDVHYRSRVVYRQDVCAHLSIVRGRCLVGEGEVVIGEQAARRLELAAGDPATLTFAQFNPDPRTPIFLAAGLPKRLTVVGVYRVPDPGGQYWGTHGYFAADPGDRPGEPVFTDATTLAAMDHGAIEMSIDGTAGPGALAVDHLGALRTGLDDLKKTAAQLSNGVTVQTSIPSLLDRIDAGRVAAHLIVPVLAVPLVLLACLSIFLAVGYGTEGRRPELAVVALRGARRGQRWWLATGENLVAILVGTVLGCLVGQLLVNLVAALRFPGVGADPGLSSLRYAPWAALAAVVAAVLAERRPLVSPVSELLRRAARVPSGARAVAAEAAVALLAVVAGVQLALSGGTLTGVGTFAAALVMLALALLGARALLPAVTRYAGRALAGRRLGVALAGFQLSRRPGAARLFALLVAAVAVTGYAACAVDVAARGRVVVAQLGTGANRVLAVGPTTRGQLLAAVRGIDPHGTYAMAAVAVPSAGPDVPAQLGVDTSRLAATSFWPAGATPPAEVAAKLHPPAPAPVVMAGRDLTVDVTTRGLDRAKPVQLSLALSSLTGLGDDVVELGDLNDGAGTYGRRVEVCREGCRLNAVELTTARGVAAVTGEVTLTGLGIINPRQAALPPAQLRDVRRWRASGLGRLTSAPDGLRIRLSAPIGLPDGLFVQPVDTPYPLPVAVAGTAYAKTMKNFDGRDVSVEPVATLPAVPRAGGFSRLFDLDYANRVAVDATPTTAGQVWLSADAPADVTDRLAARGLVVVGDTRAARMRRQLDQQGPALALWFFLLAAVLATALAGGALILAATVDRSRRVEDLSALRAQGLSRGALRQATLWTYPVLVAIATVTGLAIGLIGWWLTGWALPLAGLDPPDLPLPQWPRAPIVAAAGLAVLVVLAVVAYAAGRRTLREIA
jgi:putative ABC transport system permease protein